MALPTLTLSSPTTNAAAAFAVGHAFKKGDVPSGSQVVAPFSDFQVTPKNTWPDGSLKFALLAGKANITGGTPLSVALSIGTPSGGTNLTTADLKATSITASIDCGTFGAVSWATTDWDTPFEAWVSGPKMSSWIYRKPVGSDPHLVAWMEVRLWAGGAVSVLPWVENGYFRVAGPTNKSATYGFTLGGTSRFSGLIDLKHHQRTVLISGTMLAHWLVTDPVVTPLHDPAYLQASELVPSYSAVMAAGAARIGAQVTTFAPLQQGNFDYTSDSMAQSGYQRPIGLLPEHDVLHLVANSADRVTTYNSVVRNGFSAGRYSIHFRDEATNRPPAFSTYPTLVLNGGTDAGIKDTGGSTTSTYTPVPTGGNGPTWDAAHSPSIGYLAYLITGRFYFKEETQFAATANHFQITDWVRGGGTGVSGYTPRTGFTGASGICNSMTQTRQGAWRFRSLAQALAATPDSGDPLRSELIASVEDNCRYFHEIYVAQANNPFGIIEPAADEVYTDVATDRRMIPIWQQDFGTAAWGMALAFDLPISAPAKSKMAAFFGWKAKSVVHRLGTTAGYRYERAGVYEYAASPSTTPNFQNGTGPWYASDAAAYAGTSVNYQNVTPTTDALYFNTTDYGPPERSVWSNLVPAIAYAARHGVAGAAAAYARMTGASNYSTLAAGFNTSPVWSVQPASIGAVSVTTPGPKMRVGQLFARKMAVARFRGLGERPAQVAVNFAKPSLLEAVIVGADPKSEFLYVVDTPLPAGLSLSVYPDSSAVGSGVDGTYNAPATAYADGAGSARTLQYNFGATTSSITGISITPTTATGATTFSATVTGLGAFSAAKTFTIVSGGGSVHPTLGTFAPPPQTNAPQVVVVRATSDQDPSYKADATITIPALVSGAVNAPGATLTGAGLMVPGAATADAVPPPIIGVDGPRSRARTLICTDPQTLQDTSTGIGTFFNFSQPTKPKGTKDPNAVIDINFDWGPWLDDSSDTYASHEIIVAGGLVTIATNEVNGVISAFIGAGSWEEDCTVTCRIHTNSIPPRCDDRTVYLIITER